MYVLKSTRTDEMSMHEKHFFNLQAQLQPPSDLAAVEYSLLSCNLHQILQRLNTLCGGSEITYALSGIRKSG